MVHEVIDRREIYLMTDCHKEWNHVHKNNVACQEYLVAQIHLLHEDFHLMPVHYIWFDPISFAF